MRRKENDNRRRCSPPSSSLVNHKYPPPPPPPNTTRFFARLGVSCVKVCASAGLARDRTEQASRISYAAALKQWKHAATGGDTNKARAAEKFRQYWMDKFRGGEPSPSDTVPTEAYQVLVRELIISILSGSSGLQLKLSQSKSGDEIFCRIRAPLAVLERQADLLDYPLRFRGEIDPGPSFWNEDECREDSSEGPRINDTMLATRDDAEKVLQKLYEVSAWVR